MPDSSWKDCVNFCESATMWFSHGAQRVTLAVILLFTIAFLLYRRPNTDDAVKIAIITMTNSETSYDWISISNKHEYAEKHSYDLLWNFTSTVPKDYVKPWDKLDCIQEAAQKTASGAKTYEWLWLLDFDTLITNTEVRVEDIIEQSLQFAEAEGKHRDDIQLILTRDCEPLNAGSFFVRVSPFLPGFIEEWRSGRQSNTPQRTEQDVLRDMLLENTFQVADFSVVVPQTMFNAYPDDLNLCRDERDPRSWEKGMFLVHFPGARYWLKERDPIGRLMRKYYHAAFPERNLR